MTGTTSIGAQPVVFLSSDDWNSGLKTSKYHLAIRLARKHRVLYVNSIGLRAVRATSGDAYRMWRKLREWLRGARPVSENLFVCTPLVIPFRRFPGVEALNRRLLRFNIRWAMWRLGIHKPQLWVFLPNQVGVVGHLGEQISIYYCVDEFSLFTGVDTERLRVQERELLSKVDLVFATAIGLVEDKKHSRSDVNYAPHGVDYDHFVTALDEHLPLPGDIAHLPGKRIGFVGLIEDWIDLDIIEYAARSHPNWQFVAIGKIATDVSRLQKLGNVHLLGPREYRTLPAYEKGMHCMIVPFRITEMTRHVNPLKMREYLAAGRPVVSTDLPEVRPYRELVSIVHDADAFVAAIERELADDSPTLARARSDAMRSESWDRRFEDVMNIVESQGTATRGI